MDPYRRARRSYYFGDPIPIPSTLPTNDYVRELVIMPRPSHFVAVEKYPNLEAVSFINPYSSKESFRAIFQQINILSMTKTFGGCTLLTDLLPAGDELIAATSLFGCAPRINTWNFDDLPMERATQVIQGAKEHIRHLILGSFDESLLSSPSPVAQNLWVSIRLLPNLISLDVKSKALSEEVTLKRQVRSSNVGFHPKFGNTLRTLTVRLECFDKTVLEFASTLSSVLSSLAIDVTKEDESYEHRCDLFAPTTIPAFPSLRYLRLCSSKSDSIPTSILDYLPSSSLPQLQTLVLEINDTDDGEYDYLYEWSEVEAETWVNRIKKFSKVGGGGNLTHFDFMYPDQQGITDEVWKGFERRLREIGVEARRSWIWDQGDREEKDFSHYSEPIYDEGDEDGADYESEYVKEKPE